MTLLSKSAIFCANDLQTEEVYVPEWGGAVRMRSPTGCERDAFEASMVRGEGKDRKVDLTTMRASLVGLAVIDLHASNKSQIAQSALEQMARVYDLERETEELPADERQRIRLQRSKPLLDALHQWMIVHRQQITDSSATARALDCILRASVVRPSCV